MPPKTGKQPKDHKPTQDAPPPLTVAPAALHGGKVVGEAVMLPLDRVKPNGWNPNRMTPETRASLEHGLRTDGWLASQALLVWAVDDDGAEQMLIIDGEHRWTVARELGFETGPMVLLQGITEAKAKSLTVAMNQRRGSFDDKALEALLKGIEFEMPDLALDTGLPADTLAKLLAVPPVETPLPGTTPQPPSLSPAAQAAASPDGAPPPPATPGNSAYVRVVQVYTNANGYDAIHTAVKGLGAKYSTGGNLADTLIEALRRQCAAEGLPDPLPAPAPAADAP